MTAPDATPMRVGGGTALGYHDHYVVDGGKARIVLVTPADVMENAPMRDLLWRVRFRRKVRPRQVTGDTIYGTVENIVAIEDEGIRAYVPLPDFEARTPVFGKGDFVYDVKDDRQACSSPCPSAGHAGGTSHKRSFLRQTEGVSFVQTRSRP